MLEPVRQSYLSGRSLIWTRTNDLPDFAYFDHSIHLNKGVGCNTCHGRVDKMPLMYNQSSLQMEWCLNCHRAPEKNLRPHYVKEDPKRPSTMGDQIFNMAIPGTFGGASGYDSRGRDVQDIHQPDRAGGAWEPIW